MCEIEGCARSVNRDGLCLAHKLKTIQISTQAIQRERRGEDITGGLGTAKYVRDMYARRRAAGMPDLVPENRKAARYAPPMGVIRDKKTKEANGGI